MDTFAHGLTHLQIHRFTDSRIREFTDSQTYGFTSYGFTASRFHGLTDRGSTDSRMYAFTDLRIHGSWTCEAQIPGFFEFLIIFICEPGAPKLHFF